MWAAATAAAGDSAPAGGLSSGDAPPIFFSILWKRKRAVHGPKEKTAFGARRRIRASVLTGVGVRGCLRVCDGFSTGAAGCGADLTADSRGGVRLRSGCKDAFDQLLFPRVPLRYALPWRS